jgi:hypothetical protein
LAAPHQFDNRQRIRVILLSQGGRCHVSASGAFCDPGDERQHFVNGGFFKTMDLHYRFMDHDIIDTFYRDLPRSAFQSCQGNADEVTFFSVP